MHLIKQSTYETCLPSCLMMLLNKKANTKEEVSIWQRGWKFNYLIGQLNYVAKKYNKNFKVYVENKYYFHDLKKVKSSSIELINKKIDLALIKKLLKHQVIIYLDVYNFQKILHAPHFVLGLEEKNGKITIADPIDGKIKDISWNMLNKSIQNLRNHLKYSPVLIQMI